MHVAVWCNFDMGDVSLLLHRNTQNRFEPELSLRGLGARCCMHLVYHDNLWVSRLCFALAEGKSSENAIIMFLSSSTMWQTVENVTSLELFFDANYISDDMNRQTVDRL